MEWVKPKRRLLLGDISEADPDLMTTDTGDIDRNKFDDVLIIGDETGAVWRSQKAVQSDSAFTDNTTIQDEFNEIKIP